MNLIWVFVFISCVSWMLTGLLRRYAVVNSLMDIPNERSSHSIPTPHGGGLAIVITFLIGLIILWDKSLLEYSYLVGLAGAGLWVAIIGFMDDHGHIPARWRLLSHFIAAFWLLFWFDGQPPVLLFGVTYDLGWAGHLLASIALVWLLNLNNFMDGIDGIAGVEALSSTMVAGLLFLFVLDLPELAFIHILVAAAVAGFLMWNFPPAKIFMGDVGSGFLGLMLGALVLYSSRVIPQFFWVLLILLGVFIVDSTYTLIKRLLRGEKVYEAHCSHAYQSASRKHGGHLQVTFGVLLINLIWLTPWAIAVVFNLLEGVVALVFAYGPLILLVKYYHTGELDLSVKDS